MKITRTSEVDWTPALTKGAYANRRKQLAGEKSIGGLWELPPGKKSFPMHKHYVTEEALFVVSGRAKIRTPDGETPIGPGDYVCFPAGGPAHQLINDGQETLVYLALSTNAVGSDVVEYPETEKFGVSTGPMGVGKRFMFKTGDAVDYFHGDKEAE